MSSIVTSRLGFGSSRLHRVAFQSQRTRLIHAALDLGVSHFDTSPLYGLGLGERALGIALGGRRGQVTIATKIGLYPRLDGGRTLARVVACKMVGRAFPLLGNPSSDFSRQRASLSLNESLSRLRTDYLDLLLVHEPLMTSGEADTLLEWLCRLQEKGVIGRWGIAGAIVNVSPLVIAKHQLAHVIQTESGAAGMAAMTLRRIGRDPSFIYGVLSSSPDRSPLGIGTAIRSILERFHAATILVSTVNLRHLKELIQESQSGGPSGR
jgi:aryl-alcohol dehydrogenase-like predicted oxidoreductase